MKRLLTFLICLVACHWVTAQKDSLIIENSTVSRILHFARDSAGFYSTAFINKKAGQNYINPATEEFSITINDSILEGKDCRYKTHVFLRDQLTQTLTVMLETPFPKVFIQLVYNLYEDLPLVRKQLNVINESPGEITLTNPDVEKLRFQVVNKLDNEIYSSYGVNINRIPYKGDYNDAAIMLFNSAAQQGVVFGNEAPGVLKNTEIYTQIHGCIQLTEMAGRI